MAQGAWLLPQVRPHTGYTEYLGFEVCDVAGSVVLDQPWRQEMELGIVLLEGSVEAARDDASFMLGPRGDLRESLPDTAYFPPGGALRLHSAAGASVAVAAAPGAPGFAARRIAPEQVQVEQRGVGNTQRQVRHIIEAADPANALFLVEVITPGGHWSSFPPHRHDRHRPPEEALLEETYYVRVWPTEHRAFLAAWSEPGEQQSGFMGDGELLVIREGYHVAAASPGSTLYYLNAMAGPERLWKPVFHPAYRHLVQGWEQAPVGNDAGGR